MIDTLASVPTSTFNSVGRRQQTDPLTETKDQPPLTSGGLPRFVYVGAEYCPYCAVMRWSLVTALSRFGTFSKLEATTSSADYAPIPTFSFVGSTYTSKYVVFTPYEIADRTGAALQSTPNDVASSTRHVRRHRDDSSKPSTRARDRDIRSSTSVTATCRRVTSWLNDPIQSHRWRRPGADRNRRRHRRPELVGRQGDRLPTFGSREANYISAAICEATAASRRGLLDLAWSTGRRQGAEGANQAGLIDDAEATDVRSADVGGGKLPAPPPPRRVLPCPRDRRPGRRACAETTPRHERVDQRAKWSSSLVASLLASAIATYLTLAHYTTAVTLVVSGAAGGRSTARR